MPSEPNADRHTADLATTIHEIDCLQSSRSHRDTRRAFFAEGVRNLIQAVDSGFPLQTLIYSERLLIAPIARQIVRRQRRAGVPTFQVSPEVFRRISRTPRASGVAAIFSQRWQSLHQTSPNTGLCWIVLEAVRSPGNLGTLIRTSEAIGGAGFILVGPRIDPYDPNVVRASMGAIFRQHFVRTNDASLRHWLRRHGCRALGASPDGSADLHTFDYPRPTILILGEERSGLSPAQRALCRTLVRIPMVGAADSLNVSVSGGLLLYEVYRAWARRPSDPF